MAEYIDRNRLIKKFCNNCYFDVGEKNCAEDCYDMKIIKSLPTEDVQPVKHGGKWVNDIQCSNCGWYMEDDVTMSPMIVFFDYCPNCGAKMGGDEDNV